MTHILKSFYFKESGHAWVRPSWPIDGSSDSSQSASASRLQIFENGRPLGPPHALHEEVRLNGEGRFSHWKAGPSSMAMVIFSTSDNSNPNINGREYDFVFEYECNDNDKNRFKNRKCISDFLTHCYSTFHLDDINAIGYSSDRTAFFLGHLARSLRTFVPWGTVEEHFVDTGQYGSRSFYELLSKSFPVLCGALARMLGDCAMGMGLRARPVQFPAHVGVEIEISPDHWVYFDPSFQFYARADGEYLSARQLVERMDLVEAWDRHFNSTITCTNLLSHQFKSEFHEGEIYSPI